MNCVIIGERQNAYVFVRNELVAILFVTDSEAFEKGLQAVESWKDLPPKSIALLLDGFKNLPDSETEKLF